MEKKVRLGVIGIGNMGTSHCKNIVEKGLVPNVELAAVADRSEARRQWAKEALPETVEIFTEGTDLIENANVDAVLVAVPHYGHCELSIKAMKKGHLAAIFTIFVWGTTYISTKILLKTFNPTEILLTRFII